jgi:magnesium transporter
MIKKFNIQDGKVCESQNGDCPIMVFVNPDDNEKKYLTTDFSIDDHTLTSALDPDELARVEFEAEHMAMIFKRPKNYSAQDRFLFKVASLGIFLFKDRLIIVSSEEFPMFNGKAFAKVTTIYDFLLKLLYRAIYHYLEHLKVINQISDSLEEKINAAMENRYLLSLFTLEKSLVFYLNAINSNSIMLQKLKNYGNKIGLNEENLEFLDDIMIENAQCYKQAEIYSDILSSLMDARASIVSNNLNVLMKTLNIITIGIMVPTFVVSAFSMNVGIPFEKHPFAFWIIMTIAASSVFGFFLIWRHKKW